MDVAGSVQRNEPLVLRNMKMKSVAFGHLHATETSPNPEWQLVVIDEILRPTEPLCDDDRTFADVYAGESIMWPKHSVCKWTITGI